MRVLVRWFWCPFLLAAACFVALPADEGEGSVCAVCHEDVVAAFEGTAHALAPGWDPETGCQSCHGSGEEHIDAGGDPEKIIRPDMLPRRESSENCLTCHSRKEGHFRSATAVHGLHEVGCLDCHDPHRAVEQLLITEPLDLCSRCHADVAAQFDMPRSHPLEARGAACVACHDPHGARPLRGDAVASNRTCEHCHFEKAGPFVYDHTTVLVDGCASCHEVHGSTNRHLLRHDSQVNLCYECHNANVTPGWHSAARFVNQKCTSCHEAIHGSNTSQFFLEE